MSELLDGFAVMRRDGDIFTVAVDPEDYERVMAAGPWFVGPDGETFYARRNVRSATGRHTTELLHNFILGAKGLDHIDGNGLNNCRANLRPATQSQNGQNLRGLRKGNNSGYRGVSFHKQRGKWQARVQGDGQRGYLGLYADVEDAARAASEYRAKNMPFSADARSEGE